MIFVLVILGFVAVGMAKKAPNTTVSQELPPDTSLPAMGATDKFSPVISGNSPLVARDNRLRLDMRYRNPSTLVSRFVAPPFRPGTITGIQGNLTDAQASLKTQDVPPLVSMLDYSPSTWNSRKL